MNACTALGCVTETLKVCGVCGGAVTRTIHKADNPFSPVCGGDFSHMASRVSYQRNCLGVAHDFISAGEPVVSRGADPEAPTSARKS